MKIKLLDTFAGVGWFHLALQRAIFEKRTAKVIKNYKFKIDILVSEDELEILNNMSLKNASSYLKTRNFNN